MPERIFIYCITKIVNQDEYRVVFRCIHVIFNYRYLSTKNYCVVPESMLDVIELARGPYWENIGQGLFMDQATGKGGKGGFKNQTFRRKV